MKLCTVPLRSKEHCGILGFSPIWGDCLLVDAPSPLVPEGCCLNGNVHVYGATAADCSLLEASLVTFPLPLEGPVKIK